MNSQAIFCVTSKGVELALKINEKFESDIFVLEKFAVEKTISFNSLKEIVKKNFLEYKCYLELKINLQGNCFTHAASPSHFTYLFLPSSS